MSFFGSFFGSDQKKAIQNANKEATGYLNTSYAEGKGALGQGYGQAQNYLAPYAQQGGKAFGMYGDAIGANGADKQRAFYDGFQTDPGWMAQQQAGINALDRSAAAKGGMYSGAQQKALFNYGQQGMRGAFQDRLAQLAQMGGQGMGATGQQAGLASGYGNALANLSGQYGQNMAGNAINYGNAMAQASQMGIQNMLGLGGLAIQALAPGAGGMSAMGNMGNALMRGANSFSGGSMGFPTGGGWSTNPNAWAAR